LADCHIKVPTKDCGADHSAPAPSVNDVVRHKEKRAIFQPLAANVTGIVMVTPILTPHQPIPGDEASLGLTVVSGLDWSGDAGDPKKTPGLSPLLVTAVVHLDVENWELLEAALAGARRIRSLPPDYVFHFSGSRPQIREALFKELKRVPLSAHGRVFDKNLWAQSYFRRTNGIARIQAEIVELMIHCPDHLIGGQTLLIDGEKSETKLIAPIKTELNRRLVIGRRASLRRVKTCPDDHQSQGAIIQVADMIAGALHDAGSVAGPYLAGFESKITLV